MYKNCLKGLQTSPGPQKTAQNRLLTRPGRRPWVILAQNFIKPFSARNFIKIIFGPFWNLGGPHLSWAPPTTVHWAEPNCSLGAPHLGFWPETSFFCLFSAQVLAYFEYLSFLGSCFVVRRNLALYSSKMVQNR